ncbi:TFIIH complex serine/threonine-protein kinase subunit kin28 [Exophiala xenobiotica]|uniref:TFIIH complex serine/threonine-protein kinase subunit kin28 n=1 Tax=Lithohypha guttulata TaxID=1690604 RepID=A0ABR0KL59_9EURO|nr:TFIIH complex serine/threonine-protein kinase subunit kin28 [Lithohypha guttulata]KAK5324585.1 TFIIH complex serine/threonine-protein kinase subunit kin28 [Exophiala xenobiotica]
MAPSKAAAPSPLRPMSPSMQNTTSARSPLGKALPLRKPSIKEAKPSPKRPAQREPEQSETNSHKAKRQKVEPDYDMAEQMNRDVQNKYVKGKELGQGTYAVVYKGHLKSDPNHIVAIKRFKIIPDMKRDFGIGPDTIREIKYLQELVHNNIVRMYDVYATKDETINMVIEYFACGNLEEMIHSKMSYGLADIKAWMGMLWRAIYFCHSNFVLHRDLKPGNLLIAEDGELKIADFGLARSFAGPDLNMTATTITLWYRPPELMFGAKHYSGQVDVWSCGMILAELLIRRAFIGFADEDMAAETRQTVLGQLDLLNQSLGTPREDNWPGVSKLPDYVEMEPYKAPAGKGEFRRWFSNIDDTGLELLMWTLTFDPRRRPSAKQCLEHEWWQLEPRPTDKEHLPRKKNVDEKHVAKEIGLKPGVVDEKFTGVARKLDFGGMK